MNRMQEPVIDDGRLARSALFSEIMRKNNMRLIKAFLSILILSNVSVTLIKMTGKGSQHLTYKSIITEILVITVILGATIIFLRKKSGTYFSGYVTITSVFLNLSIFQVSFPGAPELFAANYITLALSIFYFNPLLTTYSLVMVLITQTVIFIIKPELMPAGAASNLITRYLVFIMTGIGAASGAAAARQLLKLTVAKHNESMDNLHSLREMVKTVFNSINVLKHHTTGQEEVTSGMKEVSENQAIALEVITSALEELSKNADSVNETARALYDEMNITVEAINDLKMVNDSLQGDSLHVQQTLGTVLTYSGDSSSHIEKTREKFNTVQAKSSEMSNFISVINDIADHVNLLSLNASIEAARAGDTGRGFAVVAEQISKLADQTAYNSKEIERIINENSGLINESSTLIGESATLTNKLHDAISGVKKQIDTAVDKITDIDITIKTIRNLNERVHNFSRIIETSTSEQKAATENSSQTATDIAQNAGQIVRIAQTISDSSKTLNQLAENLRNLAVDIEV